METDRRGPTGMTGFIVIWIGQIVSVLASGMSGFGLSLWMYQQTERATAMGLMQVAFITPFLIMSPLAEVMVDRHRRPLVLTDQERKRECPRTSRCGSRFCSTFRTWPWFGSS
jgi:hypothetical protein